MPMDTAAPQHAQRTDLIIRTARLAGRLLLENGADVSVISLPTGTIYSFVDEDGVPHSEVVRTKSRTTNLSVVSRVNAISRAVTAGSLSMEQGFAQLEELSRTPPQPLWQGLLANGLSASFFALLFHGGGFDFAVALVCGLLTRLLGLLFSEDSVSSTLYALLSGALSAVVAVLSVRFFHMGNQTPIIIGAIMPLLPGLAITNAIRDTVNGDLVSGVARTAEALLKAVAIAAGVGTVLALLH